jgi:hypothetical protein
MLETAVTTPPPVGTPTVDLPVYADFHNHFDWSPIAFFSRTVYWIINT